MSYSFSPPDLSPQYDQDLDLESRNYWCGQVGHERPPVPSLRQIDGAMVLGRYMDPFGCQAIMDECKARWSKWYTGFLIAAGAGALFLGVDAVFLFISLPIIVVWYLVARNSHRVQYDYYWKAQQQILASGQPEWVAFDKKRLDQIKGSPLLVWP